MTRVVWLTQDQLNKAQDKVANIKSNLNVISVAVDTFRPVLTESTTVSAVRPILLNFQRVEKVIELQNGPETIIKVWELHTTVQIVPEFLAREMQQVNH